MHLGQPSSRPGLQPGSVAYGLCDLVSSLIVITGSEESGETGGAQGVLGSSLSPPAPCSTPLQVWAPRCGGQRGC